MSRFNTGMILPITFNLNHNIKQDYHSDKRTFVRNYSSDTVSFSKKPRAIDLYRAGDDESNSANLLKCLLNADYKRACKLLRLTAVRDFNPNYRDKNGMSLIGALYHSVRTPEHINQQQFVNFRNEILLRIFDHPKFEQNKPYIGIDAKVRYYIDDAVDYGDAFLAMLLYKAGNGVFDKHFDLFKTYSKQTGNNTIKYVLSQVPIFIQGAVATIPPEEDLYENKVVKPYRAVLPESIPMSLDEVGGLQEAKKAIRDFIFLPWEPEIRKRLRDNEVQLPNGFMMYGPPGCGKTYLAKVIAKQTGFPMYEVDLSSIGTSAAYQTAKTLRNIFTALEEQYSKNNKPSILFLDEIDSIAAARESSHTDWKRDDVNALITQMNNASERGIIVIGATNLIDNVDDAILRTGRFDKKIKIELPTKEERKEIIQKLTARKKIALDLYLMADELAELTEDKSPSDLSAAVNLACLKAICSGKPSVSKEDFLSAIEEIEFEKNDKHKTVGFAK